MPLRMPLSASQKEQLLKDIETIVEQISSEIGYCSCYEGDLNEVFTQAKEETAKRILRVLEAWSLI